MKYNTQAKYKRIVIQYEWSVVMHKKIFSEREREMLGKFLTEGKTPETFRTLRMLIKRNYTRLSRDFQLLEKVYAEFNREI